tara:strand:+ start:505 stop:1077 length:573 start_codon:yes stop_codon:yes gene_type:complete
MKWLVVCLGNPGARYHKTRHNLGWMVANHLAQSLPTTKRTIRNAGRVYSCEIESSCLEILQPSNYVNNSGKSVVKVLENLGICLSSLVVVHDDIDLKLGSVRVKTEGSSGGHNGIKSIISAVKSDQFVRIRMGVGRPPSGVDAADFVLESFLDSELSSVNTMISLASRTVCALVVKEPGQVIPEIPIIEN